MTWKYVLALLRHKWFVFVAGRRLGVPLWRLLVHDLSKLLPDELPCYARGHNGLSQSKAVFALAKLRHKNRNSHHWKHWLDGDVAYPMPEACIREMIADWWGAERSRYGTWDMRPWLSANLQKMEMHEKTRDRVRTIIWNLSF